MKKIAIVLISVVTLFSCTKDYLMNTFLLTEEEQRTIPFKGGETVFYKNSIDNEVIMLSVESNITELHKCFYGHSSKKYDEYETREVILRGSDVSIIYSLNSNGKIYKRKSDLSICLKIESEDVVSFLDRMTVPLDTADRFSNLVLYDSLLVNGKMYYEVYSGNFNSPAYSDNTISETTIYPVNYYYEEQNGIIKFVFSDSTSWDLENIEW